MEFNKEKPIYLQIVDWMNDNILGGEWNSDERIPSVRDVAMVLQVNPNTAMRAFDHLQSEHVIYNKRGIGYFVEPDARTKILDSEKKRFLTEILPDIFTRMELLGISSEDLHEEYKNHKASKQ